MSSISQEFNEYISLESLINELEASGMDQAELERFLRLFLSEVVAKSEQAAETESA